MKLLEKNESGYALIVVLLVLIVLSIMATTFFSASLSHRKQEARVEAGTLSVGAAEMGVRATHYELRRGIEGVWQPIADDVDLQLESLEGQLVDLASNGKPAPNGTCQDSDLQKWADCVASSVNETAKADFRKGVIGYLTQYEMDHKGSRVTLDDAVGYLLSEIEKTETEIGTSIVGADYVVQGTEGSREREVFGKLTVEIPEFLSKQEEDRKLVTTRPSDPEMVNEKIMTPPATNKSCKHPSYKVPEPCIWPDNDSGLLSWLQRNSDRASELTIILKDICSATGKGNNCNINNSDFYDATLFVKPERSSDEMSNGNLNKFRRSNLYYDGPFDIHNWNNVEDNNITVRGFDAHGSIGMTRNIVTVLGGANMSLKWKSVQVSNGSRFCINLAGLEKPSPSLFTSKNFKVSSGSKVVFYPSKMYSFLPNSNGHSILYTDNYVDFLSHCELSAKGDSGEYTIYGNQRNSAKIETEVDYHP